MRIDFDPTADGRPIDVRASLTSLPFPDRSVAVMVCYHVLEHVPDDAAAMSDIARVLRLDGLAIVQVPWRPMLPTDEDPGAGRDERIRRFGQADHVRYYGVDFEDRLRRAGLAVSRVTPRALVGPAACRWMNLRPDEAVWIVRPARLIGDGASGVDSAGALAGLLEQLLARNNVLERRLVKARFEAKRWKQRYELVHDHWVLRWYRRVARPAARLLGRSRH